MPSPITAYLEHINHEVSKLSTIGLSSLTEVLDSAEVELTRDLARWQYLGKGADRFTPQMYRNALVQIRGTLEHIRGPVAEGLASTLRHSGIVASALATRHLISEVEYFSKMFEGSARPVAIEASSVLAEGKGIVFKRFASSASRYAGQGHTQATSHRRSTRRDGRSIDYSSSQARRTKRHRLDERTTR
jgi:hypothetical protein